MRGFFQVLKLALMASMVVAVLAAVGAAPLMRRLPMALVGMWLLLGLAREANRQVQ